MVKVIGRKFNIPEADLENLDVDLLVESAFLENELPPKPNPP